jgi:hypothetical protein
LKPDIETAKAQVTPQIQAQLTGIVQWGDAKRNELDRAATSIASSIAAVGLTVEKVKGDTSIQVASTTANITEWGSAQKADVGKALAIRGPPSCEI